MRPVSRKEIRGKNQDVAARVDALGLFCPIPMVKLKLALEDVAAREVVEILADDPGFAEDLISWCEETGHRLLSIDRDEEGVFTAYVEKI